MAVVGRLKLVLYDEHRVVGQVTADEIKGVRADRMFGAAELELDAQRFGQMVDVAEQPGREVVGLVAPHLTGRHRLQTTELDLVHAL